MRDLIAGLCAALGIVMALVNASRAQTTYQGSVQRNGTGGYFFNGPNGQLQGGTTPNGTSGYNLYSTTPSPGVQTFPITPPRPAPSTNWLGGKNELGW